MGALGDSFFWFGGGVAKPWKGFGKDGEQRWGGLFKELKSTGEGRGLEGGLLEVAVEESLEAGTVACFVLCHFVD